MSRSFETGRTIYMTAAVGLAASLLLAGCTNETTPTISVSDVSPAITGSSQLPAAPEPTSRTTLLAKPDTSHDITVVSLNVCGGKCNKSVVKPVSDLIVETALGQAADMIGTQEMCYDQYADTARRLAQVGYKSVMTTAHISGDCGNQPGHTQTKSSERYGPAMFIKTSQIKDYTAIELPNPAKAQGRYMGCVSAPVKGNWIRFCNTHDAYQEPSTTAQAARVYQGLLDQRATKLIFSGDLNIYQNSPQLTPFMRSFHHVEPADSGQRVDHIFTTGQAISAERFADAKHRTDHKILEMKIRF